MDEIGWQMIEHWKKYFHDIVRVLRVPTVVRLVNTANCYGSIAHTIASLVFQSFCVPEESIQSMFVAIEEIELFFQTSYEDSKYYTGSTIELKFYNLQGVVTKTTRYDTHLTT